MDLTGMLTWQNVFGTIILCLGIYVITYAIRTLVSGLWKGAEDNRYFRSLLLPLGPLVNGALVGLTLKMFPWPELLGTSTLNHVFYGTVCGLFSSWVYKHVTDWLNSKAKDLEEKNNKDNMV